MFLSFVSFFEAICEKITIWGLSNVFLKFMYLIFWNTKIPFIKKNYIFQFKLGIVLVLNFIAKLLDLLNKSHYLWYIHLYVIEIWFRFMQFWISFLFFIETHFDKKISTNVFHIPCYKSFKTFLVQIFLLV